MAKVTQLTLDENGELSRKRIHLREISGDADAPLETVGQDLRAARLRRGDDLASVSKALKIRKDHLEAVEEDRIDALPGRTYAVGFVRSYADYLGLDSVQYVERFKNQIAGREEAAPKPQAFADDHEERRLPHGWVIIAVVVLLLIVYGAYHLAMSADTLLRPVEPVPTRMAAKPPVPPPHTVPPSMALAPQPQITQPVIGDSRTMGSQSTPDSSRSPSSTTNPQANLAPANKTQVGKTQTLPQPIDAAAPDQSQAEALVVPKGFVYGQQNANARVTIRVMQPTKILIQAADGTVFINRMLKAGDSYQVPDRVGLTLSTPNGAAVELVLDGQAMGHASKRPQVTEALSLDPQAIVDRYNRGQSG
ncbi:MAG: helix-turn-helix domain-containing protein [Proteobacteria bacterium]|nr:helix-turn-helix domain-containing protein [Pseudomonadota bacterium]